MTYEHFSAIKKIGYLVRFFRRERGYTQLQMAEKLDISHRSLQRIELGEAEPKLDTLHKISQVLGISLSALLRPTNQELLSIKDYSTAKEQAEFNLIKNQITANETDLSLIEKLIVQDKHWIPTDALDLYAKLDGSTVTLSAALSKLTGINGKIQNIDDHIAFGSSLERWELVFRLKLTQAIIENYYFFPTGFKALEEYHFNVNPNPEAPTSECYIRDVTHRYELETLFLNLKKAKASGIR